MLRGVIAEKWEQSVVIDVHGVGYEVRVTPSVWQACRSGQEMLLYTYFHVREDAQVLYGFADSQERSMFQTLLGVNGVGPKIAMAVLSIASPGDIVAAVQAEDAAALKAPGVGPKIVKRLITELKPKFGEAAFSREVSKHSSTPKGEAATALVQLGYTEIEVREMLELVDVDGVSTQEIIKQALQKR